jgi:uncharacterized integral membrane protein
MTNAQHAAQHQSAPPAKAAPDSSRKMLFGALIAAALLAVLMLTLVALR